MIWHLQKRHEKAPSISGGDESRKFTPIHSLICLFAHLLILTPLMVSANPGPIEYRAEAHRTFDGIEIDGVLNEPDWQNAKPLDKFIQVEPDAGKPMTEPMAVRILYDQENIYFGFTCTDSDISKLVANEMRRDSRELYNNDNVFLILDAYNDRRSGVAFRVNALGAVQDTAVTNSGDGFNRNWDAVVECRSQIHADRWTSEIAIPFSQLRFKGSEQMTWGLNLARGIRRNNEEATWVPVPSSYGGRAKYRTAYLGNLVGLEGITPKRRIELLPYVLPGVSRTEEDDDTGGKSEGAGEATIDVGLDLKYGLTSNLTADLTFNTDFAQVEADEEQVNLTRFSLFFPEKRPFFLEGAGLFDFGIPRTSFRRPPPLLLFYGRRIGIAEGHAVPIVAGGKITGKVGPYGVGLLNVLTDEFHTDESVADPDEIVDVPRISYSVLRLTRDIFSGSRIGLIAINKQEDSDAYNRAGGFDFSYRPDDKLEVRGLWARTFDSEDPSGQRDAWYVGSDWRSDVFRLEGLFTDIGENFNPAVGFVRRTGSRRLRGEMRYAPRIRKFGIREIQVGPEFDYIFTGDNELETRDIVFGSRLELTNGERISLQARRTKERLDEDFDIQDDIIIPIGDYEFTSFRASAGTNDSKMISGRLGVSFGDFFDGDRSGFDIDTTFKPNGRLVLESQYQFNRIELPAGAFSANVFATRVAYSFSTTLFAKLFAQWNSNDHVVSTNFLLNYIYRPGSNFFLVFNQVYDSSGSKTELSESTVVGKMTYWWNP